MTDQSTEILTSSGEGYLTWPQPFQTVEQLQATVAEQAQQIERLDEALRGVLSWAEYTAGDGYNLTEHEIWEELHTIELARAALQPKEGDQ